LAPLALCLGALAIAPAAARADDQVAGDAIHALPGLIRVGAAGPMDRGLALSAVAGYGYLGSVLAESDAHHRTGVDLAASYRPLRWLALAGRFTGRYDRHTDTPGGTDSGWVGDPRLAVRVAGPRPIGPLSFAAQVSMWMPGSNAPSLQPSATTVDALGMATWVPGRGALVLTSQVGFRYDRSARSAPDADRLSEADRMALGVSEANAILVGAGVRVRAGRAELLAEWSWDRLIGSRAPDARRAPMRVGAGLRHPLGRSIAFQLSGELSLAEAEPITAMDPVYPVEPRFTGLAGLTFRLGGYERLGDRLLADDGGGDGDLGGGDDRPPDELDGRVAVVVSAGGAPVEGATLKLARAGAKPESATTDAEGRASFEKVPAGKATITVRHPDHEEQSQEVEVAPGSTAELAVALERALPPGQLRGVVRGFNGKPLAAQLTIAPLGLKTESDAHGEFEIDLPPGTYEVEITSSGFKPQSRSIVIERDEVVILNVDLRR
jgi:hypothetical protein